MKLDYLFLFDACSDLSFLGFVVDQQLQSYLVDSGWMLPILTLIASYLISTISKVLCYTWMIYMYFVPRAITRVSVESRVL